MFGTILFSCANIICKLIDYKGMTMIYPVLCKRYRCMYCWYYMIIFFFFSFPQVKNQGKLTKYGIIVFKLHKLTVRGMQIPPAEMHIRLRVRAILSSRRTYKVCERPPYLRGKQREQDSPRGGATSTRRHGELAGLRGRGTAKWSSVRLRWGHLGAPKTGLEAAKGTGGDKCWSHEVR